VEKPELSRKIVDSIMEKRLAATIATNGSTPAKN
jgi:hypothetical protein